MDRKNKKNLGNWGEKLAGLYYQKYGWKIITKNYLTRYGELDLVCEKKGKIMVVEVKTRRNLQYGWAEETISQEKIKKIKNTYQILSHQKNLPEFFQLEICLIELKGKKAKISIIKI